MGLFQHVLTMEHFTWTMNAAMLILCVGQGDFDNASRLMTSLLVRYERNKAQMMAQLARVYNASSKDKKSLMVRVNSTVCINSLFFLESLLMCEEYRRASDFIASNATLQRVFESQEMMPDQLRQYRVVRVVLRVCCHPPSYVLTPEDESVLASVESSQWMLYQPLLCNMMLARPSIFPSQMLQDRLALWKNKCIDKNNESFGYSEYLRIAGLLRRDRSMVEKAVEWARDSGLVVFEAMASKSLQSMM